MRMFGWILVVLIGAIAAASLAPGVLGISTLYGPTQLIAFRPLLAGACLVLALFFGALAGLVRVFSAGRARRLGTLALIAGLVMAGHIGVILTRGISDVRPPVAADAQPGDVTVVSVNMLEDEADTSRVVEVIANSGADAVMLPEAGDIDELIRGLSVAGLNFTAFDGAVATEGASARGTALLVRDTMGDYEAAAASTEGSVRADPADGQGPTLVAVHPIAPAILPGYTWQMQWWRKELAESASICRQLPGAIVAGDFNATLDHGPMRDLGACIDAATTAGVGGVGTWPARLPRLLGAPIDHIITDGEAFSVVSAAVVDIQGTDHRGVVARLRPTG